MRKTYRDGGGFEEAAAYSRAVRIGQHVAVSGTAPMTTASATLRADARRRSRRRSRQPRSSVRDARTCSARGCCSRSAPTGRRAVRAHREAFAGVDPANTSYFVAGFIPDGVLVEVELDAIVPTNRRGRARATCGSPSSVARRAAVSRCGRCRGRSRVSASASARRAFCSTITIAIPSALISTSLSKTRSIACGESPADGSSRSSSRGRVTSARASATSFRWPPESVPARCRGRSARIGNSSRTRCDRGVPLCPREHERADVQVLGDGQRREDVLDLRHEVEPASGESVGAQAGDVLAVEAHRAGVAA